MQSHDTSVCNRYRADMVLRRKELDMKIKLTRQKYHWWLFIGQTLSVVWNLQHGTIYFCRPVTRPKLHYASRLVIKLWPIFRLPS